MDLPDSLRSLVEKYKWLFVPPPPPPPPPEEKRTRATALLARRAPPPPPPKEPPLSPRRVLIGLEAALLLMAVLMGMRTWHRLVGNWPAWKGNIRPPQALKFGSVALLDVDEKQAWVVTPRDLILIDLGGGRGVTVKMTSGLPSSVVTAIQRRGEETWIGTTEGLAYYAEGKIRRLKKSETVAKAHIKCLGVDGSGRLWVGTARKGLFVRTREGWKSFFDELPSPYITALASWDREGMLISPYSGGVLLSQGRELERLPGPYHAQTMTVRGMAVMSSNEFVALTDESLHRVRRGAWSKLDVKGLESKEKLVMIRRLREDQLLAVTNAGGLLRIDVESGRARRIGLEGKATALSVDRGKIFAAVDGVVVNVAGGERTPLSTWGRFMDVAHYHPPTADLPQDWKDPRFRREAGRLAAVALLLGAALLTRSFRWRITSDSEAWRVMPLRQAAGACAALGLLFVAESLDLIDPYAHKIVWIPIVALTGVMLIVHAMRVVAHEWKRAQDAFWLGVVIVLSALGMWLWWGLGSLMPSLLVCAAGGLLTGRALGGLSRGQWRGFMYFWGIAVWLFQLAALLPPLLFAGMTWSRAALAMRPTAPIVEELSRMPERLVWSSDGLRASFVVPTAAGGTLTLVDGSKSGWNTADFASPSGEIFPSFSPDGKLSAFCYEEDGDAVVEIIGTDAERKWLARVPGKPVTGWQPWWERGGDALLLLTVSRGRTSVWRLEKVGRHAFKRDAVRVMRIQRRLSWPWLSSDGRTLVCAFEHQGVPGIVRVFLETQELKFIEPQIARPVPALVYGPSEEGMAVLRLAGKARDTVRSSLAWLRARLQAVVDYLGWRVRVRELWIEWKKKELPPPGPGFTWNDYELVREVTEGTSGRMIACVARHQSGSDHLLYMNENGKDVRVIHSTRGNLFGLRWASFKNRLMVVEEGHSRLGPVLLAPFPVRTLLMVEGLPGTADVNVTVPFNHWLSSPQFSPDGMRIIYAAPDQFWRIALRPSSTYTLFEVMLEGGGRKYNPPAGAVPVEGGH